MLGLSAHAQPIPALDVPPERTCREQAGPPAGPAWEEALSTCVVDAYRERGRPAARAWIAVDGEVVTIGVDEGRIHRVRWLGASSLKRLTLADNLELGPGDILEADLLEQSLERIARAHDLRSVTWSLSDGDDYVGNGMGQLVPERILNVHVVREEEQGWGVGAEVVPRWGLVTEVTWDGSQQQADDHFHSELEIATPYQQWVTEQEPQLRWTYGALRASYRAPTVAGTSVAPLLGADTSLSQYQRLDIGVETSFVQEGRADLALVVGVRGAMQLRLGIAGEGALVYDTAQVPGAEPVSTEPVLRVLGHARWTFAPDDGTLRLDLRDELVLSTDAGWTTDGQPILRLGAEGQYVAGVGQSDAIVRGHGAWLEGGLRFFDEIPIAGVYQRVFFGDLLWATELAQVEVAYRQHVRRDVKIGAYHDVSVFNRPDHANDLAVVNAFGPGLHFTLLDLFSLDLYYGFGLSVDGLGHNLSLRLQSLY